MSHYLSIPASSYPRIVIIGGGFGGLKLAKLLRSQPYQVVLIDKNNYHAFQPLLYQVATAALEPASIASPFRILFEKSPNIIFRLAEVTQIIPEKNIIQTNIGEVTYDHLVIATGTETNFFGMNDVRQHAVPMKTIPQALDIRSMLLQNFEKAVNLEKKSDEQESLIDIVVVGGGPTGVEMAGALAELKKNVLPEDFPELDFNQMDIYLVEAGSRLLATMSEEASNKTKQFLEELGVIVWLNTSLKNYDGYRAVFNNDKTILTTTLIFAAGVKGALPAGFPQEVLVRGNRLMTGDDLRVKGYKNIYAIGDVSAFEPQGSPTPLPMVAPVAIQMAQYLSGYFRKNLPEKHPSFRYKDKGSMATAGKHKAVVDLHYWKTQGVLAWFVWMFVHLMSLVGFGNRLLVLFNWAQSYFSSDRKYRLIIRPYQRNKQG